MAGPPGPPARPREVILMIVSRHSPANSPGGRRPVLWRVVGAVARALRHVHREQMLMWDCWSRSGRVPVHRDGPLAWEPTPRRAPADRPPPPPQTTPTPEARDDPARTDRLAHRTAASSAACLASPGQ